MSKKYELTEEVVHNLSQYICDRIYNNGKAKLFNILEASMEEGQKLNAAKRLVENVLDTMNVDVQVSIKRTLENGDFEGQVTG